MNMNNLLGQIEIIKKRLAGIQEELKLMTVEGKDEDNLITAVVNGKGEVINYQLNTGFMDVIKQEKLIKALIEATNDGTGKARELESKKKEELLGEFNIPDIPGLFDKQ